MTEQASPEIRLGQLISTLNRHRRDLRSAEIDANPHEAANAFRGIRTMHEVIRRHCTEHVLPRPIDVPEND